MEAFHGSYEHITFRPIKIEVLEALVNAIQRNFLSSSKCTLQNCKIPQNLSQFAFNRCILHYDVIFNDADVIISPDLRIDQFEMLSDKMQQMFLHLI